MNTPAQITEWLHNNSHCAHHDLINSLLEAGHPQKASFEWVRNYFADQFNPSAGLIKIEADVLNHLLGIKPGWPDKNGMPVVAPTLRVDSRPIAKNNQTNQSKTLTTEPELFAPGMDFGPYFPNALLSRDLGFHQIASVCTAPRIMHVMNVLTNQECDELIAASRPKLERSTVVSNSTDDFRGVDNTRTSYGTYFHRGSSELIRRIEHRLSQIFKFPTLHGESLQILNYAPGAEYKPHFDYFAAGTKGGDEAMKRGGNRVATIIMYLNNVELGGATIFPDVHFQVLPIKGSAVYFDYRLPNAQVDPRTLHGGAPVQQGEKWIATKWVRELPWG